MKITRRGMNRFLFFRLPTAFFCGVRLVELKETRASSSVTHRWFNSNPFRSMYFAVQSMAAELTTGVLVIQKIKESNREISMLVTSHQGTFMKKATGKIIFSCTDGKKIDKAITMAIESGEGQKIELSSTGVNSHGEQVAHYTFEWSIKLRTTT